MRRSIRPRPRLAFWPSTSDPGSRRANRPTADCWRCSTPRLAGHVRRSPPTSAAERLLWSCHDHEDPGHHRHRLSRSRQDQPDPASRRERRRQPAGAADQRVRRPRRRQGAARRLRHRGLPRRRRDRARQRLHLLHGGRRFPPRDAHDPGPSPGARSHRDRDLGPGPAQAAGRPRSTGPRCAAG